jgi:hypothetical protein
VLSLSDPQMKRVIDAAKALDVDKRILVRISENLKRAPENIRPDEFDRVLAASLRGLVHAA